MAVWSQHRADWPGFRNYAHGRYRRRYAIGIAIIATLAYLSVLVSCSHTDGKYLGSSVVQSFAHASVPLETPDHDTDEEFCNLLHKQVVALQAFSIGTVLSAKTLHLDIAIGEEVPLLIARVNAFRPPGHGFSPAKIVNLQLSSVLRI